MLASSPFPGRSSCDQAPPAQAPAFAPDPYTAAAGSVRHDMGELPSLRHMAGREREIKTIFVYWGRAGEGFHSSSMPRTDRIFSEITGEALLGPHASRPPVDATHRRWERVETAGEDARGPSVLLQPHPKALVW